MSLFQYLPRFDYVLVDLANYSDGEISAFQIGMLKSILLAFKHSTDKAYWLQHFGDALQNLDFNTETSVLLDLLHQILTYLLPPGRYTDKEADAIINQIPEPLKVKNMTYIEQIEKKAERRAERRALKQGKIEGKIETTREMVISMHQNGLPIAVIAQIAKISEAEVVEIINQYKEQ